MRLALCQMNATVGDIAGNAERIREGRRGAAAAGAARVGLTVCEDIWEPGPPASEEALAGATLIVNISASPYHAGKGLERERMFAQRARDNLACVAFCALVGGQDELVFDGHSCVVDHTGQTIARAAQFREELLVCDLDLEAAAATRLREAGHRSAARSSPRAHAQVLPAVATVGKSSPPQRRSGGPLAQPLAPEEAEVYAALRLGLRDYVEKNGFEHVVLGLSGGVDSALVACIAADTLGSERVSAAVMPSPYSSGETQADARTLAAALGLQLFELPIAEIFEAYRRDLAAALRTGDGDDGSSGPAVVGAGGGATGADGGEDLTEENLQGRIRGNLMMELSNRFGWVV